VVTVDEMHWDSIDGDTNGAHAQDRDGCAIDHYDELSRDYSVGDEVTLLPERIIYGSRVCDTEMCGRDLVWRS
jgi:hypothetical protein